jgi:hypothetical protein
MASPPSSPWQSPSPGLEIARFENPSVVVVRVDPAHYDFRLLSAKGKGFKTAPSAAEWVERHGVTGVINASMFQADHLTSVAYMRDGKAVNNGSWNRDKAVFVSQPLQPGLPPVRILDRSCEDAVGIARKYRVAVQNIRMIDCKRRNVWAPQPRKSSTACVGMDGRGRVLLIHARAPQATHDLIGVLLALPLDLRRLMYVEGGREASLYVKVGGRVVVSETGDFVAGLFGGNDKSGLWPLPNVIAFAGR